MKTIKMVSALLLAALLLSGCDFFRSLLGKPTSEDIERMKTEALEQARRKRAEDSLARAKADSLAFAQELEARKNRLKGRYQVVIGSFREHANADKMLAMLEQRGYTPQRIRFVNGFDAVAVAAFDGYRDALREMEALLEFEFTPEDIWVYDVRQGLHQE